VISPTSRPLPDNTRRSHKTDIHATGGIGARNARRRMAETHAVDRAVTGIKFFNVHISYRLFSSDTSKCYLRSSGDWNVCLPNLSICKARDKMPYEVERDDGIFVRWYHHFSSRVWFDICLHLLYLPLSLLYEVSRKDGALPSLYDFHIPYLKSLLFSPTVALYICLGVNFNVNFNIFLSKYIVHPLVKIKEILIISRCTVQLWKKSYSVHLIFSHHCVGLCSENGRFCGAL
jgi:hypothetical protein